jgi:ABC-type amino acid transport substrate-binding protein
VVPFVGAQEGLAAVAGGEIDAFVLNELVLKHLARKEFPGRVQVLPGIYDDYFVSIALTQDSPLRKPVNKALLQLMRTTAWTELRNRYIE